jgi:hypothetical protein
MSLKSSYRQLQDDFRAAGPSAHAPLSAAEGEHARLGAVESE